jgi:hypothetical protein
MIRQSDPSGEGETLSLPRLFLREPGWKVGHKHDSQREFCFQVYPGDDSHHRIAVGEMFVYSPDERLCLPCADRRGLIQFEPLALRNAIVGRSVTAAELSEEDSIPVLDRYGVRDADEHEPPSLRQ